MILSAYVFTLRLFGGIFEYGQCNMNNKTQSLKCERGFLFTLDQNSKVEVFQTIF